MVDLCCLPHRLDEDAATCRVVIETPQGSRQKYTYDSEAEAFELGSLLPEGMVLPLAFGFVPSTCAEDGDPLDVMVFTDEPVPMGLLADVRLVGVIEAEELDGGETYRSDRLIAVAKCSTRFAEIASVKDLDPSFIDQMKAFWVSYNGVKAKEFRIIRLSDARRAAQVVAKAARTS
jgi:inorganic pyrophosphatase